MRTSSSVSPEPAVSTSHSPEPVFDVAVGDTIGGKKRIKLAEVDDDGKEKREDVDFSTGAVVLENLTNDVDILAASLTGTNTWSGLPVSVGALGTALVALRATGGGEPRRRTQLGARHEFEARDGWHLA